MDPLRSWRAHRGAPSLSSFPLALVLTAAGALVLPSCSGNHDAPAELRIDEDGDGLDDTTELAGWRIWIDDTGRGMEFAEVRTVTSDPENADTDGDGLSDRLEFEHHTDPRLADTDIDGLGDLQEVRQWRTNPVSVDTDGDARGPSAQMPPNAALFDGNEVRLLGTSPTLDDTDGDGRTDFEEFDDPSFDPRIADLPRCALVVDGDIDVRLNVEYAENLGAETQYGTAITRSQTNTQRSSRSTTHSVGVEVTVGFEHEFGLLGGTTLSGSVTASYDYSTQVTTEQETASTLQEESSRYQTDRRELSEVNSSGTIAIPMRLENTGDSTFTLTDLSVAVLHWVPGQTENSGRFRVMTTLQAARGEFTLPPGARTPILEVSNTTVDPAVIKEFLAHPGSLVLEPALFDLRDQNGIDYDFLTERTFRRTALVEIDFGDEVRTFRVATNVGRTADGGYTGVTMREVMNDILRLPRGDAQDGYLVDEVPSTAQGQPFPPGVFALTGICGRDYVAGPTPTRPRAFWTIASTRPEHVDPHLSFEDIVLFGGDQIRLIYCRDGDSDGLYDFEEQFYGNDDLATDTDGDGLSDADEVKVGWLLGGDGRRVHSDPRLVDTDRDGWTDQQEFAALTDPGDPDTDDDGLSDSADPAPLDAARTVYVRQFAAGSGTSWADAFGTLQQALALANEKNLQNTDPTDDVGEIWVARGVYAVAAVGESFALQPRLGIYGGFRGDETKLGARDANPLSNGTVLSGDFGTGQALHVVRAGEGLGPDAVLDGFTITGGLAAGSYPDNMGGGLFCEGTPTLRRLFFYQNRASDYGGAVFVGRTTAPAGAVAFEQCLFNRNTSRHGGALMAWVGDSPVLVRGCTFEENLTATLGGEPVGGVDVGGGAIHLYGAGPSRGSLRVEDSSFRSNQTGRDGVFFGSGSAAWIQNANALFVGCEFQQNVAWGHESYGGFGYGTVTGDYGATLAFANCSFVANTARVGAAVLGYYVHMVNCTVADNVMTGWRRYWSWQHFGFRDDPDCGAVHALASADLTNTILWGNSCPNGSDDPTNCQYRGSVRAAYSCIQSLRSYVGIGTTSADPKFEAWRLRQDSPCIDAGTDFVDVDPFLPGRQALPALDLAGNPRIVDGDGRSGARVDMGAFELQR